MKSLEIIKRYWLGLSVLVIGVIVCIAMYFASLKRSAEAAEAAFADAKTQTESTVKKNLEDEARTRAYEKNKVTNEVTISVGTLRDEAELEVLEVYDVQYMIADEEANEDGIISWLMVPGKGVYTVDLTASEFIVDNERQYVLVRVPEPELKNCTIIYKDVEQLLFNNSGFNESISVGEDAARKQLQDGYVLIQKTLGSNPSFYQSAELSAKRMITGLVKALNTKVENLTVEVEFIN